MEEEEDEDEEGAADKAMEGLSEASQPIISGVVGQGFLQPWAPACIKHTVPTHDKPKALKATFPGPHNHIRDFEGSAVAQHTVTVTAAAAAGPNLPESRGGRMGKSESQMDIMEKSSKPGKRRWTVVEIGLSVLLLLLSCALVGLIVVYTSTVKGQQQEHGSSDSVCTSAECVVAAARLLQNMDASVEPCVLETENKEDRAAIRKAKTLYSSCMNESLIEQQDSQPLLRLIDSIGDWPIASDDWNATTEEAWSLEDQLATLISRFHRKVLLDMNVWTDDRDSGSHIIYVRKIAYERLCERPPKPPLLMWHINYSMCAVSL
ncbi:hypothetical protein CRUP_022061 [Coryphaenoides rupestris]|nr:hypothetical protein CRUP_022061 [Coryphaenoides rupestris]